MKREMTLRELTEALTFRDTIKQENERNFRDIFFLNPIVMTITKMDGTIVKVNEAFTRVTGFEKDDVYGKTVVEVGLYKYPEERKEIIALLKEKGLMMHRPVMFLSKNGREVPCIMSSKVIQIKEEDHIISAIADDSWRIEREDCK